MTSVSIKVTSKHMTITNYKLMIARYESNCAFSELKLSIAGS
jgi:hypothetical protein